jgi:hypothetical protein
MEKKQGTFFSSCPKKDCGEVFCEFGRRNVGAFHGSGSMENDGEPHQVSLLESFDKKNHSPLSHYRGGSRSRPYSIPMTMRPSKKSLTSSGRVSISWEMNFIQSGTILSDLRCR